MTSLQWRRQGLGDCRVFSAPWAFGEGVQFFLPGGGVLGPVDLLQRRRDSVAVFVGNESPANCGSSRLYARPKKSSANCTPWNSSPLATRVAQSLSIYREPEKHRQARIVQSAGFGR